MVFTWINSFLCDYRCAYAYVWHAGIGLYVRHDSLICVTWLIYMCDMTHLCGRQDSFLWVSHDSLMDLSVMSLNGLHMNAHIHARNAHMRRANSCVWHAGICFYGWQDSAICVMWLIYMCDMTHSYVWLDSCVSVPWLIYSCDILNYMCAMTHLYLWNDTFMCVTWLIYIFVQSLIYMLDMTHLYVWHDSFIRVIWLICTCDMTHLYLWNDSFICACAMTHLYL